MQVLTVGEFKANFSNVLKSVLKGDKVVVSYGKKKKKVILVSPYKSKKNPNRVKLGFLEGKATFKIKKGFKMSDEEFLNS